MAAQPAPVVGDDLSAAPPARADWLTQALAFLLVAGGIVLVALDGGSYDVVVRQRLAVVVWWLIAIAVLAGLMPRNAPRAPGWVVGGALVALGVWTAVGFGWTLSDERTLTEVARVASHLAVIVLVAGTLGPATWRAVVAGATAGAVAITVVALGSRLAPSVFGEDVVAEAFGHRRLSVPLNYWNAVGSWAGMTSALCLGWSAHVRAWWLRGAVLAVLPAAVLVSYLTYSRASLFGTVLGIVVVLALSRNRWTAAVHGLVALAAGALLIVAVRDEPSIATGEGTAGAGDVVAFVLLAVAAVFVVGALTARLRLDAARLAPALARRVVAVAAVVTLVAGVGAGVAFGPRAWDSFTTTANIQADDPAARLTNLQGTRSAVWKAGLQSWEDHPFKGTGAGTYEIAWNQRGTTPEFIRDGHSLYLEALTELGVLGLLCLLTLLVGVVWAFVAALRRVSSPLERGALAAAAGGVTAFFFGSAVDWLWESTANAVLALVLLGAVLSLSGRTVPRPPRARWRLPLALGALVCCLVQLPGLVSTSEVRKSQSAVAAGDFASARAHAQEALEAQPWAASPLVQRALVAERAGDLRAARADLERAQTREPQDWRLPLLLARVRARAGDADGALVSYRRARALRPRAQFFARP